MNFLLLSQSLFAIVYSLPLCLSPVIGPVTLTMPTKTTISERAKAAWKVGRHVLRVGMLVSVIVVGYATSKPKPRIDQFFRVL